jgi:hypothetical protein
MTTQVKAKRSFYHDLVGSRAQGEVFHVTDSTTLKVLEQQGYVEKVDAQANQAEMQKRQQEMGQAQAQANEAVSKATHDQNMAANQHTQSINQYEQEQVQSLGADHMNEFDKKAFEQQQKHFNPASVNAKATGKKETDK